MLLSGTFSLHCPLTSKFWIQCSAEHFKPYTTQFLYVYSSIPLHMELQILEFNKCIMKLQEMLNEKLVFSEPYHAHNILYFWEENGDLSMKIHNGVTFLSILTMKRVWIKQIILNLAAARIFCKNWSKESKCTFRNIYHFCLIFHYKVSKSFININ